jgi:ABC-type polysaccharide/polyol phosphate transport system ATPase subunit
VTGTLARNGSGHNLAPGQVVLEEAWRSFPARTDRAKTLKEAFTSLIGSRPPELPPTRALAGVTLHIDPGETVGVVGRNGAGKTSTLRVLAGIIPLHRGFAGCGGRVATLIELGAGFGREFTGRENMRLNAALNGMGREEIDERIGDMIAFSELGHFIDAPIKTYSSGMLVRLGFSVAAHLDADVLLIDEVLAVGDEAFQRKCLRRIAAHIERGSTVVLVSHAPATIEHACRRTVVLDGGQVVYDGPTAAGLRFYHRLMGLESAVPTDGLLGEPAVLQEVRLEDGDGRPRQVFASGERLRVAMMLQPTASTGQVELLVEVRPVAGEAVFRTSHQVTVGLERQLVCFDVASLNLLGGDYDLAVGVRQPGEDAPVRFDRVLSFSVAPVSGAEGVVDLRGSWMLGADRLEVGPVEGGSEVRL